MKPEDVTDAIELAEASLKQDEQYLRRSERSGYEQALSWEELINCLEVRGPPVERDDQRLVYDKDGNLVPTMSGSFPAINWYNIYDDEKGERLIARAASGDAVAFGLLCIVAARFVEAGCAMPERLRKYIADFLFSQPKAAGESRRRGPAPYGNHTRNFYIACTIHHIVKEGFKPTRNRATTEVESACSIVAKALPKIGVHLSESAVEKIWGEFSESFLSETDEYES